MQKTALLISRFVVGVLFIFSGLIKANDPMGLSYKMQEFFEIWGWQWMNDFTLPISILLIGFEIVAGVAVLLGWKFEIFSWLLLLLILFFTFLTGYALFSGKIRECGCFGDCIKLTARESFLKDIILLGLILYLFSNRKKVQPIHAHSLVAVLVLLSIFFSFGFQWYVLRHLPVVDCLPYKTGNNILEKMKIPQDALPDSTVITFVYEKNGAEIEFDAEHFPADFNDSIYHFKKRYDKLVRKGNAVPEVKDFILQNQSGMDMTHIFLEKPSAKLMLMIRNIPSDYREYQKNIRMVYDLSGSLGSDFAIVTPVARQVGDKMGDIWGNQTPEIYNCDAVAVKTASRSAITLYYLNQGTVLKKWAYPDFDKAISYLNQQKKN